MAARFESSVKLPRMPEDEEMRMFVKRGAPDWVYFVIIIGTLGLLLVGMHALMQFLDPSTMYNPGPN
jgi:hypothetical protein